LGRQARPLVLFFAAYLATALVTSALMIRDYLVSGFHRAPLRYAENDYVHYPKVGLGKWPPFFH
jgi:hypothetical protein